MNPVPKAPLTQPEELSKKIAKLYADSHTFPETVSKEWPDTFATKAMEIIKPFLESAQKEAYDKGFESGVQVGHAAEAESRDRFES